MAQDMAGRASRRGPRTKYGAVRTTVDGLTFSSRRESRRYAELVLLLRAGQIRDLVLQPKYAIDVSGRHISTYIADFAYTDLTTGQTVVEDVKGVRTPLFILKKKLVEALHPFTIREVR